MEFKRTEVVATIYGEKVSLKKPTFDEKAEFLTAVDKAVKDNKADEIIKLQRSFAITLGLPESVLKDMEAEHVDELVMTLIGKKKS